VRFGGIADQRVLLAMQAFLEMLSAGHRMQTCSCRWLLLLQRGVETVAVAAQSEPPGCGVPHCQAA
jgi:hypothetical protein